MNTENCKKILFVCTGNTCRSPMAEAIARSELKRLGVQNVSVASAGLSVVKGDGLNQNAALVLAENGLALENFSSTLLNDELLDEAFAVVCMTERQRTAIEEKRALDFFSSGGSKGSMQENLYSFCGLAGCEIPDPYGKDLSFYRVTFENLERAVQTTLQKLGVIERFENVQNRTLEKIQNGTIEKKQELLLQVDEKEQTQPKKRGRPRKNPEKPKSDSQPKKRGRPRKVVADRLDDVKNTD